jgi:hypothetical protein
MKPNGNIKPNVRRADKSGKKAATLPLRIWAISGAAMLIIVSAWLMLTPARRDASPPPSASRAPGTEEASNPQAEAPADSPEARITEAPLAFIHAVRLQPSRPTRMDILKAEVEAAPNAPGKLAYTYHWKVNDRIIKDASGETLNLSPFKKRDIITVTVTPYDGNMAGFAVESPMVAVHSIPPSLELKAMRKARKAGEPIELQLVGVAPDGEQVAFSLEAPYVPGMTIDKSSGKITWIIEPGQKGSLRFGAAVEDDNGTKISRIFDVAVD